MIYSKVFLRLHWGFSISYPQASKAKPSYYLPPPTTLIGALSYGKFRGIDNKTYNNRTGSPALELRVRAAAAYDKSFVGGYVEDIIRNVIMYFQRKSSEGEEKKSRRMLEKLRYGVVPTGKVYAPNQIIKVVYVADMDKSELERLSWSIVRLGCKECLVSVEDVEIGEAKRVKGRLKTSYYFPATVNVIEKEKVTYVEFWDTDGFVWGKMGKPVTYAIPVVGYPLRSYEVTVEANEAYEVGGEYVVFA